MLGAHSLWIPNIYKMILIKRKKRKRWILKINKKIQKEKNVAPGERSSEDIDSKKTFKF